MSNFDYLTNTNDSLRHTVGILQECNSLLATATTSSMNKIIPEKVYGLTTTSDLNDTKSIFTENVSKQSLSNMDKIKDSMSHLSTTETKLRNIRLKQLKKLNNINDYEMFQQFQNSKTVDKLKIRSLERLIARKEQLKQLVAQR